MRGGRARARKLTPPGAQAPCHNICLFALASRALTLASAVRACSLAHSLARARALPKPTQRHFGRLRANSLAQTANALMSAPASLVSLARSPSRNWRALRNCRAPLVETFCARPKRDTFAFTLASACNARFCLKRALRNLHATTARRELIESPLRACDASRNWAATGPRQPKSDFGFLLAQVRKCASVQSALGWIEREQASERLDEL